MQRIGLDEVAPAVRADIEAQLGSAIVEWVNRPAGYGPALAAACRLADGRAA